MSRPRMSQIRDLRTCERELDRALAELRQAYGAASPNTIATSSIEYRIGALRRRREELR